jgi:lipid A 4'-phosphatase
MFWVLVLGLGSIALGPTLATPLDLDAARLFFDHSYWSNSVGWIWVQFINDFIPTIFRWALLFALCGWCYITFKKNALRWRLPLAFFVIAGTLGPGAVVNLVFKDHWQRARPYQVQEFGGDKQFTRATVMTDQCDNNCSFVSGHVACGFFLASLMLVHQRRKFVWAGVGTSAGLVIGFARMADHAHWLSDVLWAGPITLLCSWVVWKGLLWAYKAKPSVSGQT